jgi:carboxyl-terminal processing protease
VAKEIIELKMDSITGLILDLRYNGGGSMREAMGLAGIFIDEGPVAIYKPKSGSTFLLKDLNRGVIWNGPLVVLVNSASASAAELVTATLQDYNRAVIVGSTTFGKGTAQSIVMADSSYYDRNSNREQTAKFGFMKVTGGKFYRLSGHSHQGTGIAPDIKIPGVVEKVMENESAYAYFLPIDSVNKEVSFNQLSPLPKDSLRRMSQMRITSNPRFTQIGSVGDSLQQSRHNSEKVSLTLPEIKSYTEKQRKFSSHIEGLFTSAEEEQLSISSNSQNAKLLAMIEYYRRNTETTIETLKKDIILQESVNILNDLIALSAKQQP